MGGERCSESLILELEGAATRCCQLVTAGMTAGSVTDEVMMRVVEFIA